MELEVIPKSILGSGRLMAAQSHCERSEAIPFRKGISKNFFPISLGNYILFVIMIFGVQNNMVTFHPLDVLLSGVAVRTP
jgi:hypothetical protein